MHFAAVLLGFNHFYRVTAKHTHGLAIDNCLSVRLSCLSIHLSVKRKHCDKMK